MIDRAAAPGSDTDGRPLTYRLCPHCLRAVPASGKELYCINDGAPMLEACPGCRAAISSPYTRFCANCGYDLTRPAGQSSYPT